MKKLLFLLIPLCLLVYASATADVTCVVIGGHVGGEVDYGFVGNNTSETIGISADRSFGAWSSWTCTDAGLVNRICYGEYDTSWTTNAYFKLYLFRDISGTWTIQSQTACFAGQGSAGDYCVNLDSEVTLVNGDDYAIVLGMGDTYAVISANATCTTDKDETNYSYDAAACPDDESSLQDDGDTAPSSRCVRFWAEHSSDPR